MYLFVMESLSIHSDDETEHDTFFPQTCVEEVENAEYVARLKPLLSLRVEDPVDEELDPRSRLREYVDSKWKLVAKKPCYAKPTRSSWPLKQGRMGNLSQSKEDLEQKITAWQREVDLKLMKSVWGAHVRTPDEDDLSEECVCEPPRACLCCHCPPEMVEQDLLYAYQGLKETTKGEESVEDHLPTSILIRTRRQCVARSQQMKTKLTRKRRTASRNKAKNRLFRPQKPPQQFYAAVWRGRKI